MAQTIKPLYGSKTAITVTLASLGVNGIASCTAIDNSSNLYDDALVQIKIKTGGSGTTATGVINIWAYASADGGTSYPDGCGTNTASGTTNVDLRLIGQLSATVNATTYISNVMSVAAAFGGVLPQFWGIAIENRSGGSLDSTEGNHDKFFQPVQLQAV